LECARILGERGMNRIHLVDAADEIGGHVRDVSALPGLGEWARVINYRQIQLDNLKNVNVVTGTRLSKDDVLEYGADIVVIATGAHWSPTGMNGLTNEPIPNADARAQDYVVTPDQVFAGKDLGDRLVVYDLDGYFMGISLAERLVNDGHDVTLVTMFAAAAPYMEYTLEQPRTIRKVLKLGVTIVNNKVITALEPGGVSVVDIWDDSGQTIEADGAVLVTQRFPNEDLYVALRDDPDALRREGVRAVYRVGDNAVPGSIADAVFEGHRLAREIDSENPAYPLPFIRERRLINATEDDFTLESPTISIEAPPMRPVSSLGQPSGARL